MPQDSLTTDLLLRARGQNSDSPARSASEGGSAPRWRFGLARCCLPALNPATMLLALTVVASVSLPLAGEQAPDGPRATASTTAPGFAAEGALDGDRFAIDAGRAWKGKAGEKSWWWQVEFPRPRLVGAILQIHGDDPHVLRNAPKRYAWQASDDGRTWRDLTAATADEKRLFRLHRFSEAVAARFLRLAIEAASGDCPTLREVEFFADPKAEVKFEPWVVAVSTTGDDKLPGEAQSFVALARSCKGREQLQGQCVWLGDFDEAFVSAEPRPLCAFLSGNFIDWCQQKRTQWKGTQEVLHAGRLPLWASCGGAQGLALLAEYGADKPWDCPHCRDPKDPKTPLYTHIGHTAKRPCGDYSACRFERGPHNVLQLADDPIFRGLGREFKAMESHCGQIEWPPKGWMLIATRGDGALTKTQCLRRKDRYVYAAQFHIEMAGTPATSRAIMGNFLKLAESWGGYNPDAKPVAPPEAFGAQAKP